MANLAGGVLYYFLGPKAAFSSMFVMSAIGSSALTYAINADKKELVPVFIGVAKFGIAAAFNLAFIAFMFLTPARLTSSFFGFSNVLARTMTIVAPVVANIEGDLPMFINIICTLIAAVTTCFLLVKLPRFI